MIVLNFFYELGYKMSFIVLLTMDSRFENIKFVESKFVDAPLISDCMT